MATTTVLSQPALLINAVDYSDQCTSATVTINFEALEATSFADGARKYTAGLGNHEVTCTLMLLTAPAKLKRTSQLSLAPPPMLLCTQQAAPRQA